MKICRGVSPADTCCGLKTTVTLGTFDGVHIGHRYILNKVISNAEHSGEQSAVITFNRHPYEVLKPESTPKLLTTLDEKIALFEAIGINIVYIIEFTRKISEMNPEQFISRYLVDCLGMSHFIVGYDHGFGKGRKGSSEVLQKFAMKYDFTLEIQSPVEYNGIIVNSSTIRNYLLMGKTDAASDLLGTDYSFRGNVISGYGLGKKIGIPTANITLIDQEKIVPLSGVYAGWIEFIDQKREALIHLGSRPTVNRNEEGIEVHIPDFTGDLYGKEVRVGFKRRLRNIKQFESEQALVQQIKKDIEVLNQLILL